MSRAEALSRLSYDADKPASGLLRALSARLPRLTITLMNRPGKIVA